MAERHIKSTTKRIVMVMVDSATGLTPQTGKTVGVSISKNGGAWSSIGNATAIGDGAYYIDLTTTHTNTAGPLMVKATATDCATWFDVLTIVDAQLEDSALDAIAYTIWRQELDTLLGATTYGEALSTQATLAKSALGAILAVAGHQSLSGTTLTIKVDSGDSTRFTRTVAVDGNGNLTSMT